MSVGHYCKSRIYKQDLESLVATYLRMNKLAVWNQKMRAGLADFLQFSFGDDLIVDFPECEKLTLTRRRRWMRPKVWVVAFDLVKMEARLVA